MDLKKNKNKNRLGQIWAQAVKRGPAGRVWAPDKKTRLIIGPGPGRESWPAGRARVCKNPARTRPVAIPTKNKQEVWGFAKRSR